MHRLKFQVLFFIFCLFLFQGLHSQTVIWSEDFNSYADGTNNLNQTTQKWWTDAHDADDGGIRNNSDNYWGVNSGEFVVNDIEGTWACGTGSSKGGDNDNFWYSEGIDVSAYSQFIVSMKGRAVGDMECAADGEPCNSADLLVGSYQIDGGGWIPFFSMCGAKNGDISSGCVKISNAHILKLRVQAGTQANGETYYFDDIIVTSQPVISGSNTVVKGSSISLNIDATGGTWSSDNKTIATVDASGKVTGVAAGATTIKYTSAGGCETTVSITVTNPCTTPSILTTTPSSRCDAGTLTLAATASAGTISWYTQSSGGTAIATGNTFITPALTTTTSYYAEAVDATCISSRTEIKATVNATPTFVNKTENSRCDNGKVDLKATFSGGVVSWFSQASGGVAIATGGDFTTPDISGTTSYYVSSTENNCTSSRTEVKATVNVTPSLITKTENSCCANSTTTLGATYSQGTISWYSQALGGTSIGTGNNFTTPLLTGTTKYYAEASANGCISGRTMITATVKQQPSMGGFVLLPAECNNGIFSVSFPDNIIINGATILSQGWQIETAAGSNLYTSISVPYVFDCSDDGKHIRYVISTDCGDVYSLEKTIQIEIPAPELVLSTAITPYLHDGKNDIFGENDITGTSLMTFFPNGYKLVLFNRIGQWVASRENIGWNGYINGGALADPGVYYYILNSRTADGKWVSVKKGTVEVVKR